MAPEQLRAFLPEMTADRPNSGADLYALGVLLYEQLLTGRHPFGPVPRHRPNQEQELATWLLPRQQAGCVPIRSLNAEVDRALARVVESCLAFDVAKRPDAAAVARELKRQEASARRKPWVIGAACALVVALAWGTVVALTPPPYKQGQAAFAARDYDEAERQFTKALEANEKDTKAWIGPGPSPAQTAGPNRPQKQEDAAKLTRCSPGGLRSIAGRRPVLQG